MSTWIFAPTLTSPLNTLKPVSLPIDLQIIIKIRNVSIIVFCCGLPSIGIVQLFLLCFLIYIRIYLYYFKLCAANKNQLINSCSSCMSCVACHMSHVACRMSHVACRMSHVACRMSHVACCMSHVMHRMSCGACRAAHVVRRMSVLHCMSVLRHIAHVALHHACCITSCVCTCACV